MTPGWGVACLMHLITYTAAYGGDKSYSMCTACKAKQEKQFLVVHGVPILHHTAGVKGAEA